MKQQDIKVLSKTELKEMQPAEAHEIIAGWLRKNSAGFDKNTLERIVEASKTLKNGSQIDVQQSYYCMLTKHQIILKRR